MNEETCEQLKEVLKILNKINDNVCYLVKIKKESERIKNEKIMMDEFLYNMQFV